MTGKKTTILIALALAVAFPGQCFAEGVSTSGVTSGVYDISSGEPVADNLDDLKTLVNRAENLNLVENAILTVVVPSNLDFTIDPFQLNERGQIYSDNFLLQNYGPTDVTVRLENIKYTFENETDFVSLDSPPEKPSGLRPSSRLKEMYMLLHYENRDIDDFVITTKERSEMADIILAAAEYDDNGNFVSLNEESSLVFNFAGIVNHMSEIEWENNDLVVSITYTIVADEPSEPEMELAADDPDEIASEGAGTLSQISLETNSEYVDSSNPEEKVEAITDEPELQSEVESETEAETSLEESPQLESSDGGENADESEHSIIQSEPQGLSADE